MIIKFFAFSREGKSKLYVDSTKHIKVKTFYFYQFYMNYIMKGRNWNIVDNLYIIKDNLISQRSWIKLSLVYKENPIILLENFFIWSYTMKDNDEK